MNLGEAVTRMTAGQLMTRVLHTVTPRSSVQEALQLMTGLYWDLGDQAAQLPRRR